MLKQLVTILLVVLLVANYGEAQEFPIAKPGCNNTCGNVTIPYPFGMADECSYSSNYFITCNHTFDPPRAFFGAGNVQVTEISVDGKLRILQYIAHDCYNKSGRASLGIPWLRIFNPSFTISDTDNIFVSIGCDTQASLQGYQSDHGYTVGCISVCDRKEYVTSGACSGIGCCQTSLAKGITNISLILKSFTNHSGILDFNPCSYAFVIAKPDFRFSPASLSGMDFLKKVPMVLDWFIGINNCTTLKKNMMYSACQGNSTCYDPENGSGYLCKCLDGYQGNPYLPHGCQDIDECKSSTLNDCEEGNCVNTQGSYTCVCPGGYFGDGRKRGKGCNVAPSGSILIPVIVGTGGGLAALIAGSICLLVGIQRWKIVKQKQKFFQQNGGLMLLELSRLQGPNAETAKVFTAEELEKATDNYDESRIVGRGGFGTVYKGTLADERIVAIKRSKVVDRSRVSHFINEVLVLSQINHRNVVKLLGCCLETEVPMLVYEFVNNDTLFDHIHNKKKASSLTWGLRLKIAAETAGVLSYLHSTASVPIIHRDIKPTNILLDENYTAKVSDFGTSRLAPMDQAELSTIVQGTLGYLDPEYLLTSQLTEKSDVYSFGVVLVELLTGKKALCFGRGETERTLANYFLCALKEDQLMQVVEDWMVDETNIEQVKEVANLAKRCLSVKGEERPGMKQVAMELEGIGMMVDQNHPWTATEESKFEESEWLLSVKSSEMVPSEDAASTSGGYDTIRNQIILSVHSVHDAR